VSVTLLVSSCQAYVCLWSHPMHECTTVLQSGENAKARTSDVWSPSAASASFASPVFESHIRMALSFDKSVPHPLRMPTNGRPACALQSAHQAEGHPSENPTAVWFDPKMLRQACFRRARRPQSLHTPNGHSIFATVPTRSSRLEECVSRSPPKHARVIIVRALPQFCQQN
jgi:hypothetical protein